MRGMRVAVGMIVGLVASGHAFSEVLAAYPYLEEEDIRQATVGQPGAADSEIFDRRGQRLDRVHARSGFRHAAGGLADNRSQCRSGPLTRRSILPSAIE